ncbi:MAG: SMI1/KNR4 family protein [Pseudomonadota bacterium]
MTETKIDGAFGPVTFHAAAHRPSPALTDMEHLDAYLSEQGLELPPAYRQFLETHNGGKVAPNGFAYRYEPEAKEVLERVLDPEDEILAEPGSTLRYFHGFGSDVISDLLTFQKRVTPWGRPGLFGIASAEFGDAVVLDLATGDGYGSVHYLTIQGVAELVEEEDEFVPLAFIAPSFEVFQSGFFDFDEMMEGSQADRLQGFLDKLMGRA